MLATAIADTLAYYLATRARSAHVTYRVHAAALTDLWGHLRPEELTTRMVAEWVGSQRTLLKPASIRHRLAWLSAVYRLLEDAGQEILNPVSQVKKPPVRNTRTRIISLEEEALLRAHMPPGNWRYVRFALLTGLRRVEQFRLTVEDIDCTNSCLHILGSKNTRARVVPLSDEACEILAGIVLERAGQRWLFGCQRPERWVAAQRWVAVCFCKIVRQLGLRGVTWHTTRHTFGSRLARAGVHMRVIQELMGHSSISMTERYLHPAEDQLRQAVQALGVDTRR